MNDDPPPDDESLQLLIPAYVLLIVTGIGIRWWQFQQATAAVDLNLLAGTGILLLGAIFTASCRELWRAYDEHMSGLLGVKVQYHFLLRIAGHLLLPLTMGALLASLVAAVAIRSGPAWGQAGLDLASGFLSWSGPRVVSAIKN
jgi:hypothetical protein